MTDVPMKYVIPLMVLAGAPLGIAAYRLLPVHDTVKASPVQPMGITLPDDDVQTACKAAYSQLLVLGNAFQSNDCVDHKFIDHDTGMVAFDIITADGPKRLQFAVRRRSDGKNWDLFDPKSGKLWSQVLGD